MGRKAKIFMNKKAQSNANFSEIFKIIKVIVLALILIFAVYYLVKIIIGL